MYCVICELRAGTRSYIARAATMVKIDSAGNDHTILLGVVNTAC